MPHKKVIRRHREKDLQAKRAKTRRNGQASSQNGQGHESSGLDKSAATLLQLQRTAGNKAVLRLLQGNSSGISAGGVQTRHLQKKGLVQRHPDHAPEEEVQAKRQDQVQRAPNEQGLTKKYNVDIGSASGAGKPFTKKMLQIIAQVLADLPLSHTKGNDMLDAIVFASGGMGSASTYGHDESAPEGKRGVINVTLPDHVPAWLYVKLNQSKKWQLAQMEKGAVKSYDVVPDEEITKLAGTEPDKERKVFGGISDVNAQGNLLEGTLRHEIGHSVDQKINFTGTLGKKPQFGGWKTHYMEGSGQPSMEPKMKDYAKALLTKAGFSEESLGTKIGPYPLDVHFISYVLTTPSVATANNFIGLMDMVPDLTQFKAAAKEAVRLGLLSANVPWQLGDGSIQQITVDGRVYQRDHYKSYVSYEYAARKNAVSNYQFSSPGEWFAEAYTAFYDPSPESKARTTLSDTVQAWFTANLGPPPNQKAADEVHDPAAALRDEEGKLKEIEENEGAVEQAVEQAVVELALEL